MMRLDLFAAGTDTLLASVPVQCAMVNRAARRLGGLAAPWDVPGTPSIGRAVFRAGSITVPADPSWVKLLEEHDPDRSVGYLRESSAVAAGLLAAFQVADGAAGDAAMASVEGRTRDGLSVRVEVEDWAVLQDGTVEVRASRLREVSLVAVPAYESARVNLAASTPHGRDQVMTELARMLDLKASTPPAPPEAPAPAAPAPAPQTPASPPAAPVGDPDPSQAPRTGSGTPEQLTALASALAPFLPQSAPSAPAPERPAGPPVPPARRGLPTIHAAARAVSEWQARDGSNVHALVAALNDVIPANDAGQGFIGRETWLGQLWTAAVTGRPFVEALGQPKPLTGMKAKGWRWVTKPQVGEYAGNKAAIPSNPVATEPAEATAHRVAGGWDVDRAYIDLGDADMVAALFEAATEDYRAKSNSYVGQLLQAEAAGTVGAATDVVGLLVALGAAAGAIGARVSFLAVAPDLFGAFAGLTADEVPWWFGSTSASLDPATQSAQVPGFRFWSDPSLAAGTFVSGDSRAATYYEVGAPAGTPIKVQALNIPNGGVDLGVFGYNAVIVNDARALWAGDVAP